MLKAAIQPKKAELDKGQLENTRLKKSPVFKIHLKTSSGGAAPFSSGRVFQSQGAITKMDLFSFHQLDFHPWYDPNLKVHAGFCKARWCFEYPGPRPYRALQVMTSTLNRVRKTVGSQGNQPQSNKRHSQDGIEEHLSA